MGRRKIEIKAIKDDRNRSVTFLKRKGGLFKKAHELSVLCSVDVAVFIFGNNKKLYEYSSSDMHELIHRYQYHGGPNEHKGPSDFNRGQNDDDDDDEGDGASGMESQMMPPQFQSQPTASFPHVRHQTASASPPISNGVPFQAHQSHPVHMQRGHTPQPSISSRPGSRNDMRRMGPVMVSQPVGPHGPHPGITYMPTPPIYNPSANQPNMMAQHGAPYPYPPHQPPPQQPYMEDRRPSAPPSFNTQPPIQGVALAGRPEPSPPQPHPHQLPSHGLPNISPPPPDRRHLVPQPPPPVEPKTEAPERPKAPLINTDSAIKKMPQRKSHSIFTPIEENRSILSQHLASFEPQPNKPESAAPAAPTNRSQSADTGSVTRNGGTASPHLQQRSSTRNTSVSSIPDTGTPPSQSGGLKINGAAGVSRPRGPRLTVQIPDGGSEGAGSATGESISPRNSGETATQAPQRNSNMVLPPPSPSATTLLSAGATGPPNPFARPPPQQNVNGDTPVSALPSRFLNNELLPSPSSFYPPEWSFRASDSNTLPSPLNFATPIVGTGPSFLRDDAHPMSNGNSAAAMGSVLSITTTAGGGNGLGLGKRKSPDYEPSSQEEGHEMAGDPKRLKV